MSAQDITFTTDFETGDLRGWQPQGEAFRHQPTLGDNPTARDRGQPSNHQGRWWIGTFERFQGRRGERPGTVQGDGPTGYLQSSEFTIPQGSLTFLVGGGSAFETRVELIALNQGGDVEFRENRVYYATGSNSETLRAVTWSLDRHAGARGFIRIVDNSSGPWGHINADAFRFVPRFQMAVPARPTAGRRAGRADLQAASGPGRLHAGGGGASGYGIRTALAAGKGPRRAASGIARKIEGGPG